jgi:hypothetical protein
VTTVGQEALQSFGELSGKKSSQPIDGSSNIQLRWHTKADRVMRAKGNASGRARMAADLTMRTTKPPRALILSTGEDIPRSQSLRARMLVLEHGEGDVGWEKLTECQHDAEAGLYT